MFHLPWEAIIGLIVIYPLVIHRFHNSAIFPTLFRDPYPA